MCCYLLPTLAKGACDRTFRFVISLDLFLAVHAAPGLVRPRFHPVTKKPPGVKSLRALFDEKMGCASEVYGSPIDDETAVVSGLHPSYVMLCYVMPPSSITPSHCSLILFLCRCNMVLQLPLEV